MSPIFHATSRLRLSVWTHPHPFLVSIVAFLLATLSLAALSSAVLAQTDAVLGFGDNASGELGDATTTNRSLITPTYSISAINAIACGYNHTLALDASGTVWAWGDNNLG